MTLSGTGTAPALVSIAVTPATSSIAAGYTQPFAATGTYSNGTTQNLTTAASWTSSNASVATVKTSTGVATGVAQGTAAITATAGTISGSATLTVTPAVLTSMSVTPATASVAAGYTKQFTATGTYSNGTTQNLTSTSTWTSSANSIATVSSGGLATSVAQGAATITAASGSIGGSAAFTVTAAVLTSLSVTPGTATVAAGYTQQFTATGTYSNGTTKNLTTTASWTSSNTSVATVKINTGLAMGVAQGIATIAAASGTISGSATLTVTAAVLTSLSVTPNAPSVAAGNAQQFTATGTYSNGTTQNVTSTSTWTSSANSVATITNGGLATGVAPGTATITATSGAISGSATITVTPAVLTSLSVTPATASVALGTTQQFTATGTYSNGSTQNLTSTAKWNSSATSVATVNSGGLATSVTQGTASISAKSGTISGSATLTVTAPVLTSLSVTPTPASIAAGNSQQFTATGTYSNGSTQNLTSTAQWKSSATSVATVNGSGLAIGAAQGTATITATSAAISGSATLKVKPAVLTSISVTPATASIAAGNSQQFTATGIYSNGTTQNLTSTALWTSSATAVANVSAAGLATSLAQGSATITAASGTISGSAALAVTPAVLTSLAISPVTVSIAKGTSQQFTATGTYSDGSTQTLTSAVSWSSSLTTVATIVSTGVATGTGVGSSTITATSGSITATAALSVGQPVLVSLAVTPANPTFALGTTQALAATGTYSDGSTLDLTSSSTWTAADNTIATVNAQGLAASVAVGSTSVSASSGSISGSTTLTVNPAVLVSIAVTPAIPSIPLGTTQPFTATGTYTDGSMQNITGTVQWSSDTPAVATINNAAGSQGIASSVSEGTATITATSGSVTGSTTLNVTSAVLVSLAITPATPTLALGTSQQLTATGTFSDGTTQDLTSAATWSSDTLSTATINAAGLASSVGIGTANITATSGTVTSSTGLTVTAAALVSIAINPLASTIPLGTTQQFTATGTFTDGTTQDVTQSGHWSSTVATVATISDSAGTAGLATTLGTGTTTICIRSAGVSATATLLVNPAVLASIAISPQAPAIALGTSQQFTAMGTYTDGSTQDVTAVVTWSSSDATVAIISNSLGSYGLATSSGQGAATITAASASVSASTSITVASPALVSIAIAPINVSIPLGTSQQFSAVGTYSDGSTQDLTASVTWASDSPAVAPVSAAGLVIGTAIGAANISASSGAITNSTAVAVTAPLLVAIAVSPVTVSIAKGTSQQFTATGTYSDGSTQTLTSAVSWSSSLTTVATIVSTGVATGTGVGSSTITATSGSITATAALSVGQPVLVSLAVTPANPTFALGTTQALAATGTYSDGSTLDLTSSSTWTAADNTIATVNAQGLAASVAVGSTSVSASSGSISGSTTLTVNPAVLVSIAVTPAIPSIPLGTTQPFTATGTYTDGSMQNITGTVQWSSDTPAVATINNAAGSQGIASSVSEGTATITATSGSVTGSTTLNVTSAVLVSLAITPATPTLALGTSQQLTATGTFSDGTTQDLTSAATWSSDTLSTATINAAGLASSVGIGTANITATSGTVTSSTGLTVTAAALVSIAINPLASTIPLGTTQQFTATGTFTDGTTQDVTQSGHWSSTVATVATISDSAGTAGLATTLGTGTTTICIRSAGVSATATLLVNPAVLASIAISPQAPAIALGTSQQFTAMGTYTDGSTQDVTAVVTWSSSDATVAIISNSLGSYGLATSSGQGAATITAASASVSASTSITVGQATLTSIAVTPSSISIALGYTEQFAAIATYSDGSTQDITQSATWTSSSPNIAVVNSAGLATSMLAGMTTVSASSGSVTAGAVLTINAPVPVSLVIAPASATVFIGAPQQFGATLTYSDGSSLNVTGAVTWTSSNPAVATVNNAGLAVGVTGGSSTIGATWGANLLTANVGMTVSPPTVSITPAVASVALSATVQFGATVTGSANQNVSWSVDGIAGGNSSLGTISSAGLYAAPPMIGSHNIIAVAQANSSSQGSATLTVGSLVPVPSTFFGMHLHLATSPVPGAMAGSGRIWDSAQAQWPNINTASNTFAFGSLDSVLGDYYAAGINDALYTLWRVPNWASSNPTDATCDYASEGKSYYGECDLPTDINADGTGTDLTWRTWVQNIAQYANGQLNNPTYLSNHAHIAYWEVCNECFRSPTLDPGFVASSSATVAYRGTYAQLVRLMQDARCIILGHSGDHITALNTTCGQAGYSVIGIDPTAQMVMPSTAPGGLNAKIPPYADVMQNLLYCTCASNSCSASTTGCPTGTAGSAAVDIINAHIYAKNYAPEQIPSQIATLRSDLTATDLAKPFWDGEGGWGQNASATQLNGGNPDLEAAFLARYQVMIWASGLARSYWYQWDNSADGTLWSPTSISGCTTAFGSGDICEAGIANQQVYDWLVGSTLGACSLTGTTWTCTLTQASGSQAAITWDTSQTCSNGNCGTTQHAVSAIYSSYRDLTGASYTINNGTVPVGIKPILLEAQ